MNIPLYLLRALAGASDGLPRIGPRMRPGFAHLVLREGRVSPDLQRPRKESPWPFARPGASIPEKALISPNLSCSAESCRRGPGLRRSEGRLLVKPSRLVENVAER